mmetsp:Transcript_43430/g.114465  ORF Transcript_43430/g.114465 Transcript_43430/m.114465 type:complete len:201 (+) Transcript_43430:627-1229(+)
MCASAMQVASSLLLPTSVHVEAHDPAEDDDGHQRHHNGHVTCVQLIFAEACALQHCCLLCQQLLSRTPKGRMILDVRRADLLGYLAFLLVLIPSGAGHCHCRKCQHDRQNDDDAVVRRMPIQQHAEIRSRERARNNQPTHVKIDDRGPVALHGSSHIDKERGKGPKEDDGFGQRNSIMWREAPREHQHGHIDASAANPCC